MSIASSVQTEKASKNTFATGTSSQKEIRAGKLKALADAVVEEVDFLCRLVCSNEKEWTDMKLENAHMKQEIVDMKLEWWWHLILYWFSKLLHYN